MDRHPFSFSSPEKGGVKAKYNDSRSAWSSLLYILYSVWMMSLWLFSPSQTLPLSGHIHIFFPGTLPLAGIGLWIRPAIIPHNSGLSPKRIEEGQQKVVFVLSG
jgi:hypothetical protein